MSSGLLESRKGVYDIRDSAIYGPWEYGLDVDRTLAGKAGVSEAGIAQTARAAIEGEQAIELPIKERKQELRVRMHDVEFDSVVVGYTRSGLPLYAGDLTRQCVHGISSACSVLINNVLCASQHW